MPSDADSLLPSFLVRRYAARLGFALALAVFIVVVFGVVISAQATAELQSDVREDLVVQSGTQAAQIDTWLTATQRHARTTSRLSVLANGSEAATSDRLQRLVTAEEVPPDVVAVHVMNTDSNRFEASSNASFVGVNPAEQGAAFATDPPTFDGPDDTYVSAPFDIPLVDHPIVAVLSPIAGEDDRVLVYMTDLESRASSISATREGSTTVVVNDEGRYVAHPNESKLLTDHGDHGREQLQSLAAGERAFVAGDRMLMGLTRLRATDWTVMVHADRSTAYALASQITSDLVGLVLVAIINLGLVGVTIGSSTAVSIRRLADRARQIGEGNLAIDLTTSRSDEIGSLYRSLDRMRSNLRAKIDTAEAAQAEAEAERAETEAMTDHLESKATEYGAVLGDAAGGDLTGRVDPSSENDAMATVGESINAALDSLSATIADMKAFAREVETATESVGDTAERVDRDSEQVIASISEIHDGVGEQSRRLDTASTEMEGLSTAAEEVAASAQSVAETSREAAATGEEGREAAEAAMTELNAIERDTDAAVDAIRTLDDDLDEIGDILGVITEVVQQTDMLALNASVEAAHADADGDGFAVVAREIKTLAEETKTAAADIEDRIGRIQTQATDTVDTMERTSDRISDGVVTVQSAIEALERIVERSQAVDDGIQEIDDATADQARTATEVMEAIDELATIGQETAVEADTVSDAADRQADSIESVADSARDLRQRARDLTAMLEEFAVEASDERAANPAPRGED